MADSEQLAHRFFRAAFNSLSAVEKKVIADVLARRHTTRDVAKRYEEGLTFGQRVADRVAAFGGSWTFILIFMGALVGWVVLNSIILIRLGNEFDPYPYILLNLFLSMLAAIQAPVIMMSQNRQATRDRIDQKHDYEVNLKTEMEMMQLHDKMDAFLQQHWLNLLNLQREQIDMLRALSGERAQDTPPEEDGRV